METGDTGEVGGEKVFLDILGLLLPCFEGSVCVRGLDIDDDCLNSSLFVFLTIFRDLSRLSLLLLNLGMDVFRTKFDLALLDIVF